MVRAAPKTRTSELVHAGGNVRERQNEHETNTGAKADASLGFVPVTLVSRLFAGAPFAAGWAAAVVVPLARAVESDVPHTIFVGAMLVATIAPALLYLRRHAMQASLRWDHDTITLLRGGRVATAIVWRQASVRQRVDRSGARLVHIADAAGRSLTLATASPTGFAAPLGRARITGPQLDRVLAAARAHATFESGEPTVDPGWHASRNLSVWLLVCLGVALSTSEQHRAGPIATFAFASACAALLIDPARRVWSAIARPVGRETLVIVASSTGPAEFDTHERAHVRAHRLDGSPVLLDLGAARHPDARLPTQRGFVSAVLALPAAGSGTPYRSLETPIAATFVETRDDRVLRFEHLRAALVDVIGYGAFFATALAAALIAS